MVQRDSASQHDDVDGCQNGRDNYPSVASPKILGFSVRDCASRNVVLQPHKPALTASRCNPVIKVFYERLRAKQKPFKVAITACMRKLLTIINFMVRDGSQWKSAPSNISA